MEKSVLEELAKYEYNSLDQIDASKVETRDKAVANSGLLSGLSNLAGFTDEKGRVLTFPTDQESRNSSTSTDMESALNANNAIVFDLNQAFRVYCERNDITKTPDAAAMLDAITGFISSTASSVSGDHITYYSSANGTDQTKYRWKVEKYPGSTEKITWSMLIVEAFTNFSLEGEEAVDADNVYAGKPNQLTKAMVGFFEGALDSLRSILGLWSMDELLFNEGWRSSGYVGGIFPVSWEPTIWALFIFTEIIAAMIMLVGIVMSVLKQAAATMNTIARIHAMSQIQDLLVCGLALALLPLALRMIIALSGNLVDIVSAMRPDSLETNSPKTIQEMVKRFSSSNGTIGGLIAQCLFFGAQVYFNFFYALRALTTAILIIMAPMMVSLITVSSAKKQVTMTWLKELLANILVQPIHTFCITVILLLPTSTHGFDNLIAIYAMIPFTSMVRGLFFGPSGGFLDQAAGKGAAITNGAISGAAMGVASKAGSGLFGFAKEKFTGGDGSSGGSGSSPEEGSAGGTNTDLSNASAERNSSSVVGGSGGGAQSGANPASGGGSGSSGSGVRDEGSGDSESGTIAASIFSAQNANTSSGSAQSSSQNSGAGNTAGPDLKGHWINFKNSTIGKDLGSLARIGGGAMLGGIGGALAGAGLYQIGNPISNAGDSLILNQGRQKKDDGQRKDEEGSRNQAAGESGQNPTINESGADVGLSRKANQPVDLGSVGKRRANDSSGDQEMQVRDLNQKELDKQGISDIDDNFRTMEFTAKGDSPQAQELGAYADYLKALPHEQRRKEINDRGIEATRTDDGIQVRIDKNKWSQANDGAKISSWTNAKTGEDTVRIKSPEGGKVPSFTGAAFQAGVNPVNIPKASHALVSTGKNGRKIYRPVDVEQKMVDSGFSETAAMRTAERVGAIRELQAQGHSPAEAAKLSKKMVSGVQKRREEFSIPKAELSPAQTATMVQAVQAGEAFGTPSVYRVEYEPGTEAPSFGPKNEVSSFTGLMCHPQTPAEPYLAPAEPVSAPVDTEPVSGPAGAVPSSVHIRAAIETASVAPAASSTPAPSVPEANGTPNAPIQPPTPRINPALAQRAAAYKAVKQRTGSSEQAFAATKSIAPIPASAGTANVSMGRSNKPTPPPSEAVRTGTLLAPEKNTPPASSHARPPVTSPRSQERKRMPQSTTQQVNALPISADMMGISTEDAYPPETLSPEEQIALNEALDMDDPFADSFQ